MQSPEENFHQEELPVSPAAQERLQQVYDARYLSALRGMGRATLFHAVRSGEITQVEQTIITDEINAKRQLLTASSLSAPDEIPESNLPETQWSPTTGMTDEGVERERDWAERAYTD